MNKHLNNPHPKKKKKHYAGLLLQWIKHNNRMLMLPPTLIAFLFRNSPINEYLKTVKHIYIYIYIRCTAHKQQRY